MSSHRFSQIPRANIQRSSFDRSHGVKTTFDAGYLVPVFVDEVLPGDTFNLSANLFCRLSTPIVPFMDNLYLDSFWFYVPSRILWEHFENFMGQRDDPDSSTDYLVPTITQTNVSTGTLWDYFGLPTNVNAALTVNALPFRAYYRIYDEWFRDENLINSSQAGLYVGDGPDSSQGFGEYSENAGGWILSRCKRHDYFTSALPWPQKGPGVDIPLVGNAQVIADPSNTALILTNSKGQNLNIGIQADGYLQPQLISGSTGNIGDPVNGGRLQNDYTAYGYKSGLLADMSNVSAVTINSLRQAFQLQKFYERDARGGTRYKEILLSHFGVVSPDARLDRPEYLGGSSTRIAIKPVEQNSATDSTSPQGNLAAYGVAGDNYHGFTKSFVEHGYIVGLVSVRADLNYQQGINRLWSREVREDFYWPVFAHLGEQAILNKEIYAQGTEADNEVFGYQERYAEYRYKPSMITGKFRSSDPQSLDVWHLAQDFESLPTLSQQFIDEHPPVERVLAVTSEPQFLLDAWFDLKCVRPMPVYGVPGLVDHF